MGGDRLGPQVLRYDEPRVAQAPEFALVHRNLAADRLGNSWVHRHFDSLQVLRRLASPAGLAPARGRLVCHGFNH